MIIKRSDCDVIKCVDPDQDLWLVDNMYEDCEGFTKHEYYLAKRKGKWQDFETVSDRIGSSYTPVKEVLKLFF
jgi:hypothetical protein